MSQMPDRTALPEPGGTFRWQPELWGFSLRSRRLGEAAAHLFTTRQLRLRGEGGEARQGWEQAAASIGLDGAHVARLKQVHGRDVVVLRKGDRLVPEDEGLPEADILVSDDPSIALAVQVADCLPVLLADPRTGAVAAAHTGWRGTAAGAAAAAVHALARQFGSRPEDLVAALGPGIGPCCYQVGAELLDAFAAEGHSRDELDRWFSPDGAPANGTASRAGARPRLRLDVWTANRDQLLAAGLRPENIDVAELCTATHLGSFCSYRAEGPGTGRMAGMIRARARGS
jgi:hypothetical protein